MTRRIVGFLVMESCEDYEQALRLCRDDGPPDGYLAWRNKQAATLFPDRASARAAIERTEHYRLAFGITDLPEKKFCNVIPVGGNVLTDAQREELRTLIMDFCCTQYELDTFGKTSAPIVTTDDVLARVESLIAEGRKWRPIDTAPTGKPILTARASEFGANVCWLDVFRREWVECGQGRTTVTHSTFAPPTHWMPLPDPPQGAAHTPPETDGKG